MLEFGVLLNATFSSKNLVEANKDSICLFVFFVFSHDVVRDDFINSVKKRNSSRF